MEINKDEAQYHKILGLMPSIPAAFVTSRVDKMSYTYVVDSSMLHKG